MIIRVEGGIHGNPASGHHWSTALQYCTDTIIPEYLPYILTRIIITGEGGGRRKGKAFNTASKVAVLRPASNQTPNNHEDSLLYSII